MQYSDVTMVQQQMPDDTYRIYDKPGENRLMITPSIGKSMAGGAKAGITLGAYQQPSPLQQMEAAALTFLQGTGRTCAIQTREEIFPPQWEFTYRCR